MVAVRWRVLGIRWGSVQPVGGGSMCRMSRLVDLWKRYVETGDALVKLRFDKLGHEAVSSRWFA